MADRIDPYTDPATGVLFNKRGYRHPEVLRQFEYEQTEVRIAELRETPITGDFDLVHLRAIHAYVFQDVYDWAGEVRAAVNISKGGSSFTPASRIEEEAQRVTGSLSAENHLRGLAKEQFVDRLAHYYAEINKLHPFREGNGRATREFIGQLARAAGYELDQTRIDNDKGEWNLAAKRSFVGDLQAVKEIFREAVRPTCALAFEQLPREEAVAKHPELAAAYASLDAIRGALAKQYPGNDQAQAHFLRQVRSEVLRRLDSGKTLEIQGRAAPAALKPAERSAAMRLDRGAER